MRILYLHGFASGPSSGKARYFARRFADRGVQLEIPDLANGNFENLTISGQISLIEELAAREPVSIIGSSMGGYLAALYASRHPEVQKLALLAPAFGFTQRWTQRMPPTVAADWKRTGYMEVFHYGEARMRRIGYNLVEDAAAYPSEPSFPQPALIFHGTGDDVVPSGHSAAFAAKHPNVNLRLLASDHQLTNAVDQIWVETEAFLLG